MFFVYTHNVQTTQNVYKFSLHYMWLLMYVFCIYKALHSLLFEIAMMLFSVLLLHIFKISGPVSLFSKTYTDEFISKSYSLLI